MNYLTNHYRNLCENLQNKVNHLEKLLEANINRPSHTVLGDVFRNDQEMDQRVNQRMDVMYDLDNLVNFEDADEETRRAAARVLGDMETTNQQFGKVGTQASRADLRRSLGALKAISQTPEFQQQKSKRLSGAEDRGFTTRPYINDWRGGERVRSTDVGSGYKGIERVLSTFGEIDSTPNIRADQRNIAMNVGPVMSGEPRRRGNQQNNYEVVPFTGNPSEFRKNLSNSEVQQSIAQIEPKVNSPYNPEGAGIVAKEFPAAFERTVLSGYGFPDYAKMMATRKSK